MVSRDPSFCTAPTAAIQPPTYPHTLEKSVRHAALQLDSLSRQRLLADDELTEYLISHSFHKLMTSPESEKRYWLERLHWWIRQRWPTVGAS
jgi:hypothetical protein